MQHEVIERTSQSSESDKPGFVSQLPTSLPILPWVYYLNSLSLSFLVCKITPVKYHRDSMKVNANVFKSPCYMLHDCIKKSNSHPGTYNPISPS